MENRFVTVLQNFLVDAIDFIIVIHNIVLVIITIQRYLNRRLYCSILKGLKEIVF